VINLSDLKFIFPEIILFGIALVILIGGLFIKRRNVLGIVGLIGLGLAGITLPQSYLTEGNFFSNLLVSDWFSSFFKYIALLACGIVILISMGYKRLLDEEKTEYYFLLLIVTIAMMLAVSTNNLLMIYISIEAISLLSYILVAFNKRCGLSSEGALKYFLFGSLTTAVMLYGISFVYGLYGTLDLSLISSRLHEAQNNFMVFVPLLLIFAGLSFKCAFVPFHMWVPDAYQGAPTPISALLSVGPKAVGFAVVLRVFSHDIFISTATWVHLVTAVSIFTMTVGNIIAVNQTNIKRLLAYSSIAQAGYIMIGFVVGSALGLKAVLFYLFTYLFMNLGAFGCVALISNSINSDTIEDYAGFYKRDPFTSFILAVFLLSLAGIPPLAGFLAKFMVFAAAIEAKFVLLAVVGVINSVIALYYYVKVIRFMYLREPKTIEVQARPFALNLALVIAFAGVLFIGLWPQPFLNWIR
jgi:NADH-quinone oxidoreductase subunit N